MTESKAMSPYGDSRLDWGVKKITGNAFNMIIKHDHIIHSLPATCPHLKD